jgi:predicted acetyltransferase
MGESLPDNIEIERASKDEKLILRHLMQLYSYDFTEFEDIEMDQHGLFHYDYFDHYWTEEKRMPFLVRVDGKLAGFVLVKKEVKNDSSPYFFMAEFFIMKKYRGQGIGQTVAFYFFDHFPGEWQVSEVARNLPAQAFWRKVIGRYTGGKFMEEVMEDGDVLQVFNSRPVQSNAANG